MLRILFHLAAVFCVLGSGFGLAAETPWQKPIDVEFTAKIDGSAQRYVVMLPKNLEPDKPVDLMVLLHGHGSDRWQFIAADRDECRGLRDAAASYGMMVVSPDYRAKTSWMGPKAEADMLQILDMLREKYSIRYTLVCGGSMGASSALTFAGLHPDRVDGVVALNGTANHVEYNRFQDAIAQSFGGTKAQVPREYERRSAELNAEKLTLAAQLGGPPPVGPARQRPPALRQAETAGPPGPADRPA